METKGELELLETRAENGPIETRDENGPIETKGEPEANVSGLHPTSDCTRIILGYLLWWGEAKIFAELIPGNKLLTAISSGASWQHSAERAALVGNKEYMKYIFDKHMFDVVWPPIADIAARKGNITFLTKLRAISTYSIDLKSAMKYAAAGGHLVLMDKLKEWGARPEDGLIGAIITGCVRSLKRAVKLMAFNFEEGFLIAARLGKVDILRALWKMVGMIGWPGPEFIDKTRVITNAFVMAADGGSAAAVRLLHEFGSIDQGNWSVLYQLTIREGVKMAAKKGHLSVV